MAIEIPDFSSWATEVDQSQAEALYPVQGFQDASEQPHLWRPFGGFSVIGDTVVIQALDQHDELKSIPVDRIPYLRQVTEFDPPAGFHFTLGLQHRKGRPSMDLPPPARESQLRMLSLGTSISGIETPPATIVFGEHPDHPREPGYYIGAVHFGSLSLDCLEYTPVKSAYKFFPIATKQLRPWL